jgi:hypothetical protein
MNWFSFCQATYFVTKRSFRTFLLRGFSSAFLFQEFISSFSAKLIEMDSTGVPVEILHDAVNQIVELDLKSGLLFLDLKAFLSWILGKSFTGLLTAVNEDKRNCIMENVTITLRGGGTQTTVRTFVRFAEIRSFASQPQAGPSTSKQVKKKKEVSKLLDKPWEKSDRCST